MVIREALKIDPETAEVFIDATGSDPIPHIINGIPVHLRDIRVYVDRPGLHPQPDQLQRDLDRSNVLGSGLDFASEADDRPVTVTTPYQAADCAALPFKPRLALKLKGGTARRQPGPHRQPKMNGIGEAGIASEQKWPCPQSEFLDNAHIKTICTRVQFKAGAGNGEKCPAGSIYGNAKALTPLLSEPLKARSSCAPPNTSCPTWSSPCTTARSTSTWSARSTRSKAAPQHLRSGPRRPGLERRA